MRKVMAMAPHKAIKNPKIDEVLVEKLARDFLPDSNIKSVKVTLKDTGWAKAELNYPCPHFTSGSPVWSVVVDGDIVSPFPGRVKDKDDKDLPKDRSNKIYLAVDPETGSILAAKLPPSL
jgi:hypothetical protein